MADGTGMQVSHLGRDIFGDIFTVLEDAVAALTADPATLIMTLTKPRSAQPWLRLMKASTVWVKPAELGTNLQQLDALDLSGDVLINDTIVKVQNAIGSDTSKLVTLVSESQMSELAFNASMFVYKNAVDEPL